MNPPGTVVVPEVMIQVVADADGDADAVAGDGEDGETGGGRDVFMRG